jgi:beta-glucosidase
MTAGLAGRISSRLPSFRCGVRQLKTHVLSIAMVAALLPSTGAAASPPTSSAQQRAGALVAQMTLDEKISMVHGDQWPPAGAYAGHVPGVPRLGIPELFLSDGPNGVGNGNTGVTAFPVALAASSTWDTNVVRQYGTALGAEHAGKGHNVALSPTINILRVPEWGRAAETFSEDPYLTGQLAVAEVQGLQSQHIIATPKHYAGNNQEFYRFGVAPNGTNVNELISDRALHEIYEPGFEAAVRQGGAGSVMCAYNQVNGSQACENGDLLTGALKRAWDFSGYVVSDWFNAVKNGTKAANAGTDLEMPLGAGFGDALKQAVLSGAVAMARLDDMVRRVVTAMIQVGLFDHPVGPPATDVSTAAHRQLATDIAEQGTVLLRNDHHALPLDRSVRTLAVIGYDAGAGTNITEGGSGAVNPSGTVVTPLAGITARAGSGVRVTYAPGTLGVVALPQLQQALTGTFYASNDWTGPPVATVVGPPDFSGPPVSTLPATGWSARWTGTLNPTATGQYRFSILGNGRFRLTVDGKPLINVPYADFATLAQGITNLRAGRPVNITVEYASVAAIGPASMRLGWQPPDPALLDAAVTAARNADAAVVFVDDSTGEGSDRTSLSLPGDQDRLIEAVAAVNPRTIVVLNTGGPVLMPWLSTVDGVFEAWYPGQQYGTAIAALLFGDANPSGRLPVTFPATERQGPGRTPATFPGDGATVRYDEGILVGYRWYDATGQRPLFPFGYGLSYTDFRYDNLRVENARNGTVTVSVRITNTGRRTGAEVVQLYVGSPSATGEPPRELQRFTKVSLDPGRSTTVRFQLESRAFAYWDPRAQRWTVAPGRYHIMLGSSSRDIRATATVERRVG